MTVMMKQEKTSSWEEKAIYKFDTDDTKITQQEFVYAYIKENGSITSMDAFYFGITRLSAIIFNLRDRGINVISEDRVTKNRRRFGNTNYREYKLGE